MFCPKCGTENEAEALFCSHCGFDMSGLAGRAANAGAGDRATAQAEDETARQRRERIERGREEFQKRASVVGEQVGQQASRLGGVAKDVAAQVREGASDLPTSADEAKARWGTMTIARGIISVVALILLFLPWLEYRGALTGTWSFNLADLSSMGMWPPMPLAIIGVIAMIGGFVVEALARIEWGKWAYVAGCALVIVAALIIIVAGSDSASFYGQTVASTGATATTWLNLLLCVVGIVACFWKPKQ